MKKLTLGSTLLLAAWAVVFIVACAKSGSDSSPEPIASPPSGPPMVIPQGVRLGFYAQNEKMNSVIPNNGTIYELKAGMHNVLKYAMRTCDRAHANGGLVTCQSFLNGFNDIMIFANGSQASAVEMVLRSAVDTRCQNAYYCSNYWYSLPSFEQMILGFFGFNTFNNSYIYNPMKLNMTIWPINDSKGFELRGYAPGYDLYYNSGGLLFQFQVPVGKLEDIAWDFRLIFNGAEAASGRMVRCRNTNCDVQGY